MIMFYLCCKPTIINAIEKKKKKQDEEMSLSTEYTFNQEKQNYNELSCISNDLELNKSNDNK